MGRSQSRARLDPYVQELGYWEGTRSRLAAARLAENWHARSSPRLTQGIAWDAAARRTSDTRPVAGDPSARGASELEAHAMPVHLVRGKIQKPSVAPYFDKPVLRSCGDALPVEAPVHAVDLVRVPREVLLELAAADVPALHRGVLRSADQRPAVAGPGDLVDVTDVTTECVHVPPRAPVPQPHRPVEGGRGEPAPVRGESHVVHDFLVAGHADDRRPRHQRPPQEEREVVRAGQQPLAAAQRKCLGVPGLGSGTHLLEVLELPHLVGVGPRAYGVVGVERQAVDPVSMPFQLAQRGAVLRAPELDGAVAAGAVYGASKFGTLPGPSHLHHRRGVGGQDSRAQTGHRVPEPDRRVLRRRGQLREGRGHMEGLPAGARHRLRVATERAHQLPLLPVPHHHDLVHASRS
mmetsp:Transcript_118208/g.335279  ORF Transcript_118208/g.335279 Transcript_118208/m.335279 type:complete len:407 (-) Transcript_118208:647-1867(-)